MSVRILIADDEEIISESLSFVLTKEGFTVETAGNGQAALNKHLVNPFDIIITDIEMPELKGPELLTRALQATPEVIVLLITAYASVDTAVQALRKGAYDYIIKPIDFDDLISRINKIIAYKKVIAENIYLKQQINNDYDFNNIIGKSPAMQKIFDMIKRLSNSTSNVIVSGKSGTGKELISRAIHYNSPRKDKPFIPINCGAVVETLFESELFGHKKGSFTGALNDKIGIFSVADGGTIFLDEVSEIPLHLQVKLLRAIEQQEIFPVGETNSLKINLRIIASTNKDLTELVREGKFREDLFYRLNVVQITLPSLIDRKEDIPLLVNHFVQKYSICMNKPVKMVDNNAMHALMNHIWKGEVRELENVIERGVIFTTDEVIKIGDLPDIIKSQFFKGFELNFKNLDDAIREFEKSYIDRALELYNYDKEKVAKALNISTSTLYRRMHDLDIALK